MSRKIVGVTVGTSISPEVLKKKLDLGSGGDVDLSGYLQKTELPDAVNDALAQAKASGEFDGVGITRVDTSVTSTTPRQTTVTINLTNGQKKTFAIRDGNPGATGANGQDYVLTEADKAEIAEMAADLVDVPSDAHINSLINTALGVIENGSY